MFKSSSNFPAVIVLSANLAPVTAPSFIFPVVTALSANFASVTAPLASWSVPIPPSLTLIVISLFAAAVEIVELSPLIPIVSPSFLAIFVPLLAANVNCLFPKFVTAVFAAVAAVFAAFAVVWAASAFVFAVSAVDLTSFNCE